MFPYVYVDASRMGVVQPFGLLVAIAFAITDVLVLRRVRQRGFDLQHFKSFRVWIIASSLVFAHVLDELVCHPDVALRQPFTLLYLWNGLSSFGGFVGTVLGGLGWKYLTFDRKGLLFFVPRRREAPLELLPLADVVMSVFPVGWIFGRAGCSVVHDHPGELAPAGSWLSVAWPATDGEGIDRAYGPLHLVWGSAARWDLGLLEMIFTILLAAAFVATWKRKLPTGTYIAVACLAYAPVRFCMDNLRVDVGADPRWLGMTFAQFGTLGLFAFGVAMAFWVSRRARRSGPAGASASLAERAEPA